MTTNDEARTLAAARLAAEGAWFRHRNLTSTRALVGGVVRSVWQCSCQTTWWGDGQTFPTREQAIQWHEEHQIERTEHAAMRAIHDLTTPRDIADRLVNEASLTQLGGTQ